MRFLCRKGREAEPSTGTRFFRAGQRRSLRPLLNSVLVILVVFTVFSGVGCRDDRVSGQEQSTPENGYHFQILDSEFPRVMMAGEKGSYAVSFRNTGTETWGKDQKIGFAYHWVKISGKILVRDGLRTRIPLPVQPGSAVEITAVLQSPQGCGLFRLRPDLVEEQVAWFSEYSTRPPEDHWCLVLPAGGSAVRLLFFLFLVLSLLLHFRKEKTPGLLGCIDVLWLGLSLWVKETWLMSMIHVRPDGVGTLNLRLVSICLFLFILLLVPGKLRPWVSVAVGLFWSGVFLVDIIFFRYFGGLPSLALFSTVGQTSDVGASILSLFHFSDLWLFADLFPAALIAVNLRKIERRSRGRFVLLFLVSVGFLPALLGNAHPEDAERGMQRFSGVQTAGEMGLIGYHLLDCGNQVRKISSRTALSDEEWKTVLELFSQRRRLREGRGPFFGVAEGFNVILLQVESLQGYIVDLEVGGQEITPTLNDLARSGIYCSHCLDQTSYGRTSDAELLSESSLLPSEQGAACFRFGVDHFVGLGDVLSTRGYFTVSAVPFRGDFWNRRVTHPAYGFSRNLYARDFEKGRVIGWGLNDRDFLAQMIGKMQETPRPFMAYLITLSLHHPFEDFPEDLKELDLGDLEHTPLGGYLDAMHFFDGALKDFISGLHETGLLENTMIVIWGDHDAGIAWNETLARVSGRSSRLFDAVVEDRVPLIFLIPGCRDLQIEDPTGLADVPPTVAALTGIDPGPLPWLGRNLLLDDGEDLVVRPHGAWASSELLWTGDNRSVCYDRKTAGKLPENACKELTRQADRIVSVNELVLRADLQERIAAAMKKTPVQPERE